jgi:5-methyltetrahydrofolate--homocysteine methyltransferase
MTKKEFRDFIEKNSPVILDGATGTNLMDAGMPLGVCPEAWILEHPDVLLDLQRRYVEAGSS